MMYDRELLAINSANLSANLENLQVNEEHAKKSRVRDNAIIELLAEILEELKHDRK